jgi:putative ATPase
MSDELFPSAKPTPPMAEALRPTTLADVVGQEHLLGEGKPLRVAFETRRLHSMILWGPPGTGKTTLARLMAHAFDCEFIALSAVLSGVKEIRAAIDMAHTYLEQYKKRTILFIDEIHRFNKNQQDALLPDVENGLFTFIGATTENPSFEVNSALLSRAQVYVLEPLGEADLMKIYFRAHAEFFSTLTLEPDAIRLLVEHADGDARKFLNLIEQVRTAAEAKSLTTISAEKMMAAIPVLLRRFDKGGENFYDQISALHKSVRGSHPNAALYWFTRMIDGGAEPRYLARRIIRMAWEDIGLADPRAAQMAELAAATYDRLGSPEGELALGQAVIYMACAPKSNAGYVAFNAASAFVKEHGTAPIPLHLRNAPTKLMKDLGYGHNYRYAHDEPNAYAAGETYMPEGMNEQAWYKPTDRGLEGQIKEKLEKLKEWDREAREKGK